MGSKIHTVYKTRDGEKVPSVTTVLGLLEKPGIHYWIADITKQGYDWTKYRDDKGEIGSLVHAMILADIKGEKYDTSGYSKEQINIAENCYLSYLEWAKDKKLKPILVEQPLVSEQYGFGGTPDYYGYLDDCLVLIDYKTGGIYKEAYIQTCSYQGLLLENGYLAIEKIIILSIPRDETETFKEISFSEFNTGWELFKHLKSVYDLQKKIKM